MANYAQHVNRRSTPQTKPVLGKGMVKNNGGGYSFPVDCWTRLNRFLVMGCEGGHFQVGEAKLTVENATAIFDCLEADAMRTVAAIVQISEDGRAPKNDSAIFALAIVASSAVQITYGGLTPSQQALVVLPRVCRIPTHLFQFLGYCKALRGWGRGLRSAVAKWYTEKPLDTLALHVTKYPSREGYSHADALRLSHPKAMDTDRHAIFQYVLGKVSDVTGLPSALAKARVYRAAYGGKDQLAYIYGAEAVKRVDSPADVVSLIQRFHLVREHIPTQFLNSPEVWAALLDKMPLTAMIRNLSKMTSIGLIAPLSNAARYVRDRLQDSDALRSARVHPFSLLLAQTTYAAGKGVKGELTWRPVPQITDALESAFYESFKFVEPTGKRHYLAIDVSGSMSWESSRIANTHIHAREAAACMAMVTLRGEPESYAMAFSDGMHDLGLSRSMRLDKVVETCEEAPAGGTDCASPILDALEREIPVDAFVVYTDNDTNSAQTEHPFQALERYRRVMGIPAKMVVVSMCANGNSIADPNDAGMIDVEGFDADTPSIIAEFVR